MRNGKSKATASGRRFRLWFFPLVALMLMGLLYQQNQDVLNDRRSIAYTYLNNAWRGDIGYGAQGNYANMVSFAGLQPGDIIVGGYPGCAYGRFSHAGIYIGDGQVIESYVDLGVTVQPIEHYWTYSQAALLRVLATPQQKEAAVRYARSHLGGLFYPVAFKAGDRFWNCSKIVWEAYRQQGITLDSNDDLWIAPEAFYHSRYTQIIREKSVGD